jgi:hypothetical protein
MCFNEANVIGIQVFEVASSKECCLVTQDSIFSILFQNAHELLRCLSLQIVVCGGERSSEAHLEPSRNLFCGFWIVSLQPFEVFARKNLKEL